jgi:Helix-turn-helix domain
MRAAALSSPRLQRVLKVLSEGRAQTTRQISRRAGVMAVSACVAELRQHGAVIECVQQAAPNGQGRWWYYTLVKAPQS